MLPIETNVRAAKPPADASRGGKRRGVEALGAEMVGKLSYYERWITAFANICFEKGILTPDDVARKMAEISDRFGAKPAAE